MATGIFVSISAMVFCALVARTIVLVVGTLEPHTESEPPAEGLESAPAVRKTA